MEPAAAMAKQGKGKLGSLGPQLHATFSPRRGGRKAFEDPSPSPPPRECATTAQPDVSFQAIAFMALVLAGQVGGMHLLHPLSLKNYPAMPKLESFWDFLHSKQVLCH